MKSIATKDGLFVSLRFEGLSWNGGRRTHSEKELKIIKRIPQSMAVIKDKAGVILNPEKKAPTKPKLSAKKAPKKPTKPKEKKDEKISDNHGTGQEEISDTGD
jgi:hypothetical protein